MYMATWIGTTLFNQMGASSDRNAYFIETATRIISRDDPHSNCETHSVETRTWNLPDCMIPHARSHHSSASFGFPAATVAPAIKQHA